MSIESVKSDKKIAIVLGGTVPHCELIKQLKMRGFYVILLDYTENPPARELADEHLKESTLDKEKTLAIAKERHADLVISTCVDQANVTCCYVGEKLGLPHPYSYETALNVTDKSKMKHIMWDADIPTSKYVQAGSFEEIEQLNLKFPLMVKPADSNSANGVKKAVDMDELKKYLPQALEFSRNGKAIVEEFVEGTEISAYCVIINGRAKLLMTQERISTLDGKKNAIKCYAAYAPARISENAVKRAEEIATNLANAFGLDNTPLFFQGIVNGDDISVIEFAPRVGGGISSQTMKMATGFDIISAAIDSFLGKQINIDSWHEMTQCYAVNQLYGTSGIYKETINAEKILQDGIVDILSFYKKAGSMIDDSRASSGRVGVMVLHADSEEEVYKKAEEAFEQIDILDMCGNSIFRRELCIGRTQ